MTCVVLLAEAAVEPVRETEVDPVREAGPRGFSTTGSDGSSTCSSSSLGSTAALRLGLKKAEILGFAGESDLPCFANLGFGPGLPLVRPEKEIEMNIPSAAAYLKISMISRPLGLAPILEEQRPPPVEGLRPAQMNFSGLPF